MLMPNAGSQVSLLLQDSITPLGSSNSSNRGGTTPFFTSPRSGSAALQQSGSTPFASLADSPFVETDGPAPAEPHSAQTRSQPQAQFQPRVANSQVSPCGCESPFEVA